MIEIHPKYSINIFESNDEMIYIVEVRTYKNKFEITFDLIHVRYFYL